MSRPESESELSVRGYAVGDRAWVYDVCVRTGDSGEDATGKFRDADLLPDIYAGPYLDREPDLAFVLDGGRRPVGYVIGTADTAAFVQWYREQWIPRVAPKYPARPAVPATPDDELIGVFYTPERMLRHELSEFPAHLHIDVLPAYQGKGYGRRLITTFLEAVARAGANGAHVAVSPVNTRAQGFYLGVGFERLPIRDGTYFGYRF